MPLGRSSGARVLTGEGHQPLGGKPRLSLTPPPPAIFLVPLLLQHAASDAHQGLGSGSLPSEGLGAAACASLQSPLLTRGD